MVEYDVFSLEEFENELPEGFERKTISGTKEYVFDKELDDEFVIRIHSSVDKRNDMARDSGKDAIRVSLYNVKEDIIVGYDSKTLRIRNGEGKRWPVNMRKKIDHLEEEYKDYVYKCPFCGGYMKKIDKNGGFFGCSNYPECHYTASMGNNDEPVLVDISERAKRAYDFLVDRHDEDKCDKCKHGSNDIKHFHSSLYHYLLRNGELSDRQWACIEDEVEAEESLEFDIEENQNEENEGNDNNYKFPLEDDVTPEEMNILEEEELLDENGR